MKNQIIELITETSTKDADGFPITTELTFECFCDMQTTKRTEFYQAASAGYTARYVCLVDDIDYNICIEENGRPHKVRYMGTDFKIFREYQNKLSHSVELTLIEGDRQ